MSKIVDPVLDYFLQIPLSEGNILQFLSRNGFRVSKVQNPDGSTKSLLFYHVSYPSKTVQFNDDGLGVENFLASAQESLFFVLDETELTFLVKTPREEKGVAISKGDSDMKFPVRNVRYTGENLHNKDVEQGSIDINLVKNSNDLILSHEYIQKIFMSFIQNKKLLDIEELVALELSHTQKND